MYNCPNCAAAVGYLGDTYLCPTTRTPAPPHQPNPRTTKPHKPSGDDYYRAHRGNIARKRPRTKRPPVELTDDHYGIAAYSA